MNTRTRIALAALVVALVMLGIWKWQSTGDSSEQTKTAATAKPGKRIANKRPSTDPRKLDRGSISGTITARDGGAAIKGAKVCGSPYSRKLSSAEIREPICSNTDAAGNYRLAGLLAARYRVSAGAPSYIPRRYSDEPNDDRVRLPAGEHISDINIALNGGAVQVHGVVKDVGGGAVRGALVSVMSTTTWKVSASITTSDADGKFHAWAAPGLIYVSVMADGYASGNKRGVAPGQFMELFLTPESVLAGKVVLKGTNTGVAGATVALGRGAWRNDTSGVAITDAQGAFRFDRLQPGRYKPTAHGSGVYGEAKQSVLLGFAETREGITVEVHPALMVSGRVAIGDSKQPCPLGSVSLHDKLSGRSVDVAIKHDGSFEFDAVLPGKYKPGVRCKDNLSKDSYPDVVVSDKDVVGLEWTVTTGGSIIGKVTNASGDALASARVRASATATGARQKRTWGWARTKADGTYAMKGLAPGTYSVRCSSKSAPGLEEAKKTKVAVGQTKTVDIQLAAGGEVHGHVVDGKGTPIKGAQVRARGKSWSMGSGRARTKDDGSFVLKGLGVGDYRIVASHGWRKTLRKPGASDDDTHGVQTKVVAGEVSTVRLVVENETGAISGTVVDESGKPVTDAFIKAQRESQAAGRSKARQRSSIRWGWWGSGAPIMTDTDGAFTVKNLSPGSYTIRAYRKGGGEALAEGIKVGGSVTITIKSIGSIAGTVSIATGGTPNDFAVAVKDDKTGFSRRESFFRTNGEWAIRDLPGGTFTVSVSAAEGTTKQQVTLADGQNHKGVRFTLESRVDIKGRVVDLDDGTPVAGMSVWVRPVKGSSGNDFPTDKRKHITDAAGRFEVKRVPSGRVYVGAWSTDWQNGSHTYNRAVRTLAAGRGVIDVGEIKVAKRKLAQREFAGDLGYTLKQQDPGTDPNDRKLIVALVRPGGPAADTGLKAGDEIKKVDGHDVSGVNYSTYGPLTRVPKGTTIKLGLLRGDTITITAVKAK